MSVLEYRGVWSTATRGLLGGMVLAAVSSVAQAQGASSAPSGVTFTKDVAPILQDKCQACHRAGEMAPMSLVTYEEVRPWIRAIRTKVAEREMPPWHIDKTVGIQKFKNDKSLGEEEIATILAWIDAGAPRGNPADMPPDKVWPNTDGWQLAAEMGAPPDLIVKAKPLTMPAVGPDRWWEPAADAHLTEDRWVRAVELRPSAEGRRILHHAIVQASEMQPDRSLGEFSFLETSVGDYWQVYGANTGKLLKAGTVFHFDIHYHSVGEELTDETELGVYFYPKGYVPHYAVRHVPIGLTGIAGRAGSAGIDIPPNAIARHDAFMVVKEPALLLNFKPHMHFRGKAMCLAALYPDGRYETLSCVDHFKFNWQVNYMYADDVAPLLPVGTVLQVTSWHDNTAANRDNPDPSQWVGSGSRSVDEMTHAHTNIIYMTQAEFDQRVRERREQETHASQQQQ